MRNSAFSLVELSIVLVILGLLTGGILAGQNLIRASELRAITTEYDRYQAAFYTFRDKYFALPGDFRDASRFWGRLNSNADCVTNSSASVATPGACDGDGDGRLEDPAANGQAGELFGAWQHLANAGLVEGSYTGLSGSGSTVHVEFGDNIPRSKISQAGFTVRYWGSSLGTQSFDMPAQNWWFFGKKSSATGYTYHGALKPDEAWNIDTKMDDGTPGNGLIFSWRGSSTYTPNCVSGTDPATATYNLTNSASDACALLFKSSQ